jgi:hypothetical protein
MPVDHPRAQRGDRPDRGLADAPEDWSEAKEL